MWVACIGNALLCEYCCHAGSRLPPYLLVLVWVLALWFISFFHISHHGPQSLKDRRGAEKQRLLMSEGSARYYIGCLLLALEFLHGHGLLHRDVSVTSGGRGKDRTDDMISVVTASD